MTNRGYYIAFTKPSNVLPIGHMLRELDLSPVIPTYLKQVRVGRERRKEVRTLQVIPGIMFINSGNITLSMSVMGPMARQIRLVKNITTSNYAIVQAEEIEPLFEWAKGQPTFDTDPPKPKPKTKPKILYHLGQTVWVNQGPFAGMRGVVTGEADEESHILVEIGEGRLPVQFPSDWLMTQKTTCMAGRAVLG